MSDINMETFTVRDLNRHPAKVLKSCDLEGEVRIRARSGRTYSLKAETPPARPDAPYPDFAARRKKLRNLGLKPLTSAKQKQFDRWLRGEE